MELVVENGFNELTDDELVIIEGGNKSLGQLLTESEEGIAVAAGAGLGAKIGGSVGGPGGAAAGALIGGAVGYCAYHAFD